MSKPRPERDQDDSGEQLLERPLTPHEQAVVARAQLILFIVMGIFIIAPFVVWWLMSVKQ